MFYLCIDFGLKKIGLATSIGEIASPWKILNTNSLGSTVSQIEKIVKDNKFDKIIVGLPEGKMGKNTLKFVTALRKNKLNIETADETLTSKNATEQMIEIGIPRKKRRHQDAMSASIILQNYLDQKNNI